MYFRSQKKNAQDVSLFDSIETGADGAPLALMDVVSEDVDLMEQVSSREMAVLLRRAIDTCLTEQERQVILLRYGLAGSPPKRQREVAGILGISRSYISRIEKKALGKLPWPALDYTYFSRITGQLPASSAVRMWLAASAGESFTCSPVTMFFTEHIPSAISSSPSSTAKGTPSLLA